MAWLVEELDWDFLGHLERLLSVSAGCASETLLTEFPETQREWYNPPLNGWSGDPMDIVGLNKAFARTNLNDVYVEIMEDSTQNGRIGEAMIVKIQIDYIAALERAYRTRQSSSVRARIHSAARRQGHAQSGGLFDTGSGSLAIWLTRLLDAAHDDPSV